MDGQQEGSHHRRLKPNPLGWPMHTQVSVYDIPPSASQNQTTFPRTTDGILKSAFESYITHGIIIERGFFDALESIALANTSLEHWMRCDTT